LTETARFPTFPGLPHTHGLFPQPPHFKVRNNYAWAASATG
jgi:hypothetical protein